MDSISNGRLRSIAVFAELTPAALGALGRELRWRNFAAGETIIAQQDDTRDVLFLIDGRARVNLYSPEGKRVNFREITRGAIVGELSAIDGAPRSASVESVARSTAAMMTQHAFLAALEEYPTFRTAIMLHIV